MANFRASDIWLTSQNLRRQEPASHKSSGRTIVPIRRFEHQVGNDN